MTETFCKRICGYACESKGSSKRRVMDQIVEDIETSGLTNERIIAKADQENSMTDIQKEIAKARKGHGTAIESSRVGDSNSNGRVERAIEELAGFVKT